MLRPGDRVKILRAMTAMEKDKTPLGWAWYMDELVGTVGQVTEVSDKCVYVKHENNTVCMWPRSLLELVPEAAATAPSADEVPFGPFPSLAEIDAENDRPPYPRWEIKSPTGQITYGKCYSRLNRVDFFAGPTEATTVIHSIALPGIDSRSQARLLDRHGKPTERKHIALTTSSPSAALTNAAAKLRTEHEHKIAETATAAEVAAVKWRDFPTVEEVRPNLKRIWAFQRPDNTVFYGYFVRNGSGSFYLQRCMESGCWVEGAISNPFMILHELKARVVSGDDASQSTNPLAPIQPVKITVGPSEVVYAPGASDRPLGEVLQKRVDTLLVDDFEVDSQGQPIVYRNFAEKLAAISHRLCAKAAAKEALTSATTSDTVSEQLGATMSTEKPTSRMRRAITEATRRAPVELGLNQAHEAIVKQAARKFKGTAAEKKVVARFLTDLLGSEYGKAGLAAALATVIPQLAPLLGKHEGKADVLAEELATRSATILAVKAGSDLISLLGPLTAILSDMISSAEPPQITAGSGRSALDEISVTSAPVAATAKR